MEPVGGRMQSCRIITASPTVIAEMVFMERAGAENVIATFNGQKVMHNPVLKSISLWVSRLMAVCYTST
jgi:hypothetical protein